MCYAKARLDELTVLHLHLELGEDYKFFIKLFPPTEAKEPGIEKILLSSELRNLLIQFAGTTSDKLLQRVRGYLLRYSEELEREAWALDSEYHGPNKRSWDLRKSARKLHRLRYDMLEAQQAPASTPAPPMADPEAEAA